MIRRIIIPKKKTYTLEIPESFIGKKIELIAFEIKEPETDPSMEKEVTAIGNLFAKFDGLTFDSKGTYFFSREEATDYE
jgi:putative transposon-encoded protein